VTGRSARSRRTALSQERWRKDPLHRFGTGAVIAVMGIDRWVGDESFAEAAVCPAVTTPAAG
jgi:hypothetical protein